MVLWLSFDVDIKGILAPKFVMCVWAYKSCKKPQKQVSFSFNFFRWKILKYSVFFHVSRWPDLKSLLSGDALKYETRYKEKKLFFPVLYISCRKYMQNSAALQLRIWSSISIDFWKNKLKDESLMPEHVKGFK